MRYYVVADIHSYFSELKVALEEKGFFDDPLDHKLVICGDLFDRGDEAIELQNFVVELMEQDKVILIKGNHDDLLMELLKGWFKGSVIKHYHLTNGTMDTVCQMINSTYGTILRDLPTTYDAMMNTPFIKKIYPAMVDYYETDHYIFTHGWIPCTIMNQEAITTYLPMDNWREVGDSMWNEARWMNGIEAAHNGVIEPHKTIVCGHWHCSFGHAHYENDGGEFDNNPNFNPYYGEGIIALDACTALSRKINCILIED